MNTSGPVPWGGGQISSGHAGAQSRTEPTEGSGGGPRVPRDRPPAEGQFFLPGVMADKDRLDEEVEVLCAGAEAPLPGVRPCSGGWSGGGGRDRVLLVEVPWYPGLSLAGPSSSSSSTDTSTSEVDHGTGSGDGPAASEKEGRHWRRHSPEKANDVGAVPRAKKRCGEEGAAHAEARGAIAERSAEAQGAIVERNAEAQGAIAERSAGAERNVVAGRSTVAGSAPVAGRYHAEARSARRGKPATGLLLAGPRMPTTGQRTLRCGVAREVAKEAGGRTPAPGAGEVEAPAATGVPPVGCLVAAPITEEKID